MPDNLPYDNPGDEESKRLALLSNGDRQEVQLIFSLLRHAGIRVSKGTYFPKDSKITYALGVPISAPSSEEMRGMAGSIADIMGKFDYPNSINFYGLNHSVFIHYYDRIKVEFSAFTFRTFLKNIADNVSDKNHA